MKLCFYVTTIALLAIAAIVTMAVLFSVQWPEWQNEWAIRDNYDGFYDWADTNHNYFEETIEMYHEIDHKPSFTQYPDNWANDVDRRYLQNWGIDVNGDVTLELIQTESYHVDFDDSQLDPKLEKFRDFRDQYQSQIDSYADELRSTYGQRLDQTEAEIDQYNADYSKARGTTESLTQLVGGTSVCVAGAGGAIALAVCGKSSRYTWLAGVLIVIMILMGFATLLTGSVGLYIITICMSIGCFVSFAICDPECKLPFRMSCKQTVEDQDPSRDSRGDLTDRKRDLDTSKPCPTNQETDSTVDLGAFGDTDVLPTPGCLDRAQTQISQTVSPIIRRLQAGETS